MQKIVRVSSTSIPAATAGSIAKILRLDGCVQVQAMGAAAVNQAMKALAVARKYMQSEESDLAVRPRFETVAENGSELTLTVLEVTKDQ
mgnify:CR=1 FL=1